MKKISILLFIALFTVAFITNTSAQMTTTPEKITVNASDLTPDQLAKIKAQQELETMQQKLDTYGKWVGVGGEIGTAVREGLNSVVDVADKFGKTEVGKFTMMMIAWKVVGKDFVRIFLGLVFIIVISVIIFKSHRNFSPHKVTIKSNGWKFWLPQEYKVIEPSEFDGLQFVKVIHIFLLAGAFGLTYAIMFA